MSISIIIQSFFLKFCIDSFCNLSNFYPISLSHLFLYLWQSEFQSLLCEWKYFSLETWQEINTLLDV